MAAAYALIVCALAAAADAAAAPAAECRAYGANSCVLLTSSPSLTVHSSSAAAEITASLQSNGCALTIHGGPFRVVRVVQLDGAWAAELDVAEATGTAVVLPVGVAPPATFALFGADAATDQLIFSGVAACVNASKDAAAVGRRLGASPSRTATRSKSPTRTRTRSHPPTPTRTGCPVCPVCTTPSHSPSYSPATASCTDGLRDGAETDVDCGGGTCPQCTAGKQCVIYSDCSSSVCKGGMCQPPSCTDGIKNGAETDVDCGGGTCPQCPPGKQCAVASDCSSSVCSSGFCYP